MASHDSDGSTDGAPIATSWSAGVVNAACLLFALWTVCTNGVIAFGGSLNLLTLVFIVAVLPASYAWLRYFRPTPQRAASPIPDQQFRPGWLLAGASLLAVCVVLSWGSALSFWWTVAILLLVHLGVRLYERSSTPQTQGDGSATAAVPSRSQGIALLALCLLAASIALVSHRPDADDAFYAGLASTVADHPSDPMLQEDPLHGIGLPLHLPMYRVHSYEVGVALVSRLTGIPVLAGFHILATGLAAFLLPLAAAAFFRQTLPACWMWATALFVAVLVCVGGAHAWHANFGLVRLWHGKSIYISVVAPLIYAYALTFAAKPTARRWVLLTSALVTAIGLTSNALWGAPLAALLAVAGSIGGSWLQRTFVWRTACLASIGTVFACSYPLAVGLLAKSSTVAVHPKPLDLTRSEWADKTLTTPLGEFASPLWWIASATLLLSCTSLTPARARHFSLGISLPVWLVLLNPYLGAWVTSNLTGPSIWRAIWALPMPLLMTLCIATPLCWTRREHRTQWIFIACTILFLLALPVPNTLSPANGVTLALPGLKVPADDYRQARRMVEALPDGSIVAAPPRISLWLPTFHQAPYPLAVRDYFKPLARAGHLDAKEASRRNAISKVLAGRDPERDAQRLHNLLRRFPQLEGLAIADAPHRPAMETVVREAGFSLLRPAEATGDVSLWGRSSPAP